jgi:hypothetical protein
MLSCELRGIECHYIVIDRNSMREDILNGVSGTSYLVTLAGPMSRHFSLIGMTRLSWLGRCLHECDDSRA